MYPHLTKEGCIRKGDGSSMGGLLISIVHGEALSGALLSAPADEKRRRKTIAGEAEPLSAVP